MVLAVDEGDLVSYAGGLICDSVRAGLVVEVRLESLSDHVPLRILGVHAETLPEVFEFDQWPDAVYFSSELHERHRGVRRLIADAARRHRADIAAWGGALWLGTTPESVVAHQLSSAAQMFKLQALKAAVGLTTTEVGSVENFHGGQRRATDAVPFPCG